MGESLISTHQLSLLPERILKAEETSAIQDFCNCLWEIEKKNNFNLLRIMIVGTGSSYPAALFAVHSIKSEIRTPYVEAYTPQTALKIIEESYNIDHQARYNLVIGISYSGVTPDIESVAYLCQQKQYPFILFTGAKKEDIEKEYSWFKENIFNIFSYYNVEDTTGKEKGIISMASTIIPALLLYEISKQPKHHFNIFQNYLEDGKKFVSNLNIDEIAMAIKKKPIVHILYQYSMLPVAADIENKFIESGIANVVMHEKKNFSHGRSAILIKQDFSLIINLTSYKTDITIRNGNLHYKSRYDELLASFLKEICQKKSAHYIEIGNDSILTTTMNIIEMCKTPYLITAISNSMNIDISKPISSYPDSFLALYNYKI